MEFLYDLHRLNVATSRAMPRDRCGEPGPGSGDVQDPAPDAPGECAVPLQGDVRVGLKRRRPDTARVMLNQQRVSSRWVPHWRTSGSTVSRNFLPHVRSLETLHSSVRSERQRQDQRPRSHRRGPQLEVGSKTRNSGTPFTGFLRRTRLGWACPSRCLSDYGSGLRTARRLGRLHDCFFQRSA